MTRINVDNADIENRREEILLEYSGIAVADIIKNLAHRVAILEKKLEAAQEGAALVFESEE